MSNFSVLHIVLLDVCYKQAKYLFKPFDITLPLDKTNIKVSILHNNVSSIRYYKIKSQSETILNLHEHSLGQDKQPTQ